MDQSQPIWILQGRFGRATVNVTDKALVEHAHREFNILFKLSGDDTLGLRDKHEAIAGAQHKVIGRYAILASRSDHRHLNAGRELFVEVAETSAGPVFAKRNLTHVEALRFR